jgi:hypothetical protein
MLGTTTGNVSLLPPLPELLPVYRQFNLKCLYCEEISVVTVIDHWEKTLKEDDSSSYSSEEE